MANGLVLQPRKFGAETQMIDYTDITLLEGDENNIRLCTTKNPDGIEFTQIDGREFHRAMKDVKGFIKHFGKPIIDVIVT